MWILPSKIRSQSDSLGRRLRGSCGGRSRSPQEFTATGRRVVKIVRRYNFARREWKKFRQDESGLIVSAEIGIWLAIVIVTVVPALVVLRGAIDDYFDAQIQYYEHKACEKLLLIDPLEPTCQEEPVS